MCNMFLQMCLCVESYVSIDVCLCVESYVWFDSHFSIDVCVCVSYGYMQTSLCMHMHVCRGMYMCGVCICV